MTKPAKIDLFYTRGDTDPIAFRLTDRSGTPIDISGYAFRLSVDTEENPTDPSRPTATEVFAVNATLVDTAEGRFEFPITTAESDQTAAKYFYDVERTNASGEIRTVAKGDFTITQDITKPVP